MTQAERQRIAGLKKLLRTEDKVYVRLAKRETKLGTALKAVRRELTACLRRARKLRNEIEKIKWGNRPGPSVNMFERVKELRATGLGMTEAIAKAKEEALQKAQVQP